MEKIDNDNLINNSTVILQGNYLIKFYFTYRYPIIIKNI